MKSVFSRGIVALALFVAPAGAQTMTDELPQTAVFLGGGVRDAGELGNSGFGTLGVRYQTAPRLAWVVSATHTARGDVDCPTEVGTSCIPGRASVTALDLGLEFLYGQSTVQPYGAVSLGVAYLRRGEDDVSRLGPAYSTGLGLAVPVTGTVRLFVEARWRQETFGSINARGYAALGGVRVRL
jgi:hypothetical protein